MDIHSNLVQAKNVTLWKRGLNKLLGAWEIIKIMIYYSTEKKATHRGQNKWKLFFFCDFLCF